MQAPEVRILENQVVSPGFIDILADNAANPRRSYPVFEKFKVTDGVTTALQMHGGSGDCAEYYRTFGALPHVINYGVSTAVMRIRNMTTSIAARKKQVERCLDEGALGVSHSLEYQPTPYDEVLAYARLATKYDRPFFLHLRFSSATQETEGVEEAVQLAKDSGARVHIDHLHSTGGTYRMGEALERIRLANVHGHRITCCVYPYSFWATYLNSRRFDDGWQKRYGLTYADLQLVGTGERLTAESFVRYKILKKLVAVPPGTMPMESTVDLALKEGFCMIGSDGGIEYPVSANSHPRGAGCFATSLSHARQLGMPLETILHKMTGLPRSLMLPAMEDRGILASGAWADLVVFNQTQVNGRATVEKPNQFSDGIDMVLVNGTIAYEHGKLGFSSGTGIRYPVRTG